MARSPDTCKMVRQLRFTPAAVEQLKTLESVPSTKGLLNQVRKTLGYLELQEQSEYIQTYEQEALTQRYGVEVFESYRISDPPSVLRIFWHYEPDESGDDGNHTPVITVFGIVPHPRH